MSCTIENFTFFLPNPNRPAMYLMAGHQFRHGLFQLKLMFSGVKK
jgi:hypothetical protein